MKFTTTLLALIGAALAADPSSPAAPRMSHHPTGLREHQISTSTNEVAEPTILPLPDDPFPASDPYYIPGVPLVPGPVLPYVNPDITLPYPLNTLPSSAIPTDPEKRAALIELANAWSQKMQTRKRGIWPDSWWPQPDDLDEYYPSFCCASLEILQETCDPDEC